MNQTKVFLTECRKNGKPYVGNNIHANSWEEAEEIVRTRNRGEVVVGILVYETTLYGWGEVN